MSYPLELIKRRNYSLRNAQVYPTHLVSVHTKDAAICAYNLEFMQTRWKIELKTLSKVLKLFVGFCLYFLSRTSIPVAGCSFFRSQIAGMAQKPAQTDVQCTGRYKGNVVSLDGWIRTFLETKDVRH